VIDTADLPSSVSFGPADGGGAGQTAKAPYAGVRLDTPCAFCTGADGRGAVVFGPLGDVTFQDRNGPPLPLTAAAVSLTGTGTREVKTVLVAGNGSMRSLFTAR
jgi:hypothetical protein